MMYSISFVLLAACAIAGASPFRLEQDGRIVGGRQVDIVDFPYQVSLRFWGSHMCGAAIISENWALTASHCVDGMKTVELSCLSGSTNKQMGGTIHNVDKIVMHPNYKDTDYDYALIRVSKPFRLGEPGVATIKLTNEEPKAGNLVVASGWGRTSSGGYLPIYLRAVDVHIVDRKVCSQAYKKFTDRMICAADEGKDSCQGDSGGPLVDQTSGELVGVVSFGFGCADPKYPGVYANVANVRSWITEVSQV